MNAFTPAEPAPYDVSTFDHAAFHELEAGVPDAQRYDGWTPEKQKRFLTALSRGHTVTQACAIVGMSRQTAYALRDSARGAAFALGWKAAQLRARDCLADELMDRAFNGVRESVTSDDGRITTRHRHDNQLAWKVLARLDKHADAACTDAGAAAVRLAAADFEQYLDLVEQSAAPGRAGLFLAARFGAAGVAGEDDLAPIRTLARADRWLRTHVDHSAAVPPISTRPTAPAGPASNGFAPRPPVSSPSLPKHPRRRRLTKTPICVSFVSLTAISTRPSGGATTARAGAPASPRRRTLTAMRMASRATRIMSAT